MRAAKVQASLRIRAVSPEPPLLAHTSSVSRATFRRKARSLPPLNGWACAVKICHEGMLEDTNSLDAAHIMHRLHKVMLPSVFISQLSTHCCSPLVSVSLGLLVSFFPFEEFPGDFLLPVYLPLSITVVLVHARVVLFEIVMLSSPL